MDTFDHIRQLLADYDATHPGAAQLDRMIYLEFKLRLPELLLMRVDKITMSVSLEARVPYLDHRLVEFAAAIPARFKVRGGKGKHVLKKAVRGLVPDAVLDRKKRGFGAPMAQWMRPGPFLDHVRDRIMRSGLQTAGVLDYTTVRRLLEIQGSGRADLSIVRVGALQPGRVVRPDDRPCTVRGGLADALGSTGVVVVPRDDSAVHGRRSDVARVVLSLPRRGLFSIHNDGHPVDRDRVGEAYRVSPDDVQYVQPLNAARTLGRKIERTRSASAGAPDTAVAAPPPPSDSPSRRGSERCWTTPV